MAVHTRRYFVKNIPLSTSDDDVASYFKRMGKLSNISVGSNAAGKFAFFTVEGLSHKLDQYASKYSSKKWNDHEITLELAKKESFLTRLKREQEESQLEGKRELNPSSSEEVNGVGNFGTPTPIGARKRRKIDSADDDSEPEERQGVPKFSGTTSLHKKVRVIEEAISKATEVSDVMPSFTAFDKMWEDGDDVSNTSLLTSLIGKKRENTTDANNKDEKRSKSKVDGSRSAPMTKLEKKKRDDERRRQSLSERASMIRNQQKVIKSALSGEDKPKARKIIFESDDDEKSNKPTVVEKRALFDDNDDDDTFEIPVKSAKEHERSHKLMHLQSSFNHDERFKVDERFLDEEADTVEIDHSEKNRHPEMVRYDPSKLNQFQVQDKPSDKQKVNLKKAILKEAPVVSKEKFYEVSDSMKASLADKNPGFSILAAYGDKNRRKQVDTFTVSEEYSIKPIKLKNPLIDDSSDDEMPVEGGEARTDSSSEKWIPVTNVPMGPRDNFFFSTDDPLFAEALDFMNKKNSEEAKAAAEKYDETRRELKKIVKNQVLKRTKKADMFRKKVGGMKKKKIPGRSNFALGKRRNNVKR